MSNEMIPCPACASDDTSSIQVRIYPSARSGVVYYRCNQCHSFFNPAPYDLKVETEHTKLTAWGSRNPGSKLSEFKSLMYDSILDLLKTYKPAPSTLIDIGCSYAGFISRADRLGYDVHGIDILPDAIDYTVSKGFNAHLAVSISDVKEKIADLPVDVISVLDTNCYFVNQKKELNHIHEQLSNGGILVMRVVDKTFFFKLGLLVHKVLPSLGNKIMTKSVNDHLFSMPVKSLINLLNSSGFEVLYASPKEALHSKQTSIWVKLLFRLGLVLWSITGINIAPGCVIVAAKK